LVSLSAAFLAAVLAWMAGKYKKELKELEENNKVFEEWKNLKDVEKVGESRASSADDS
jgi:hypothetical protein